ncbi:hypothetical protein [Haloarchaeobius sp. HRN-SO-5]|uniref:hypothetical protein n=1 Tax=Haloarchaeobius sp. HRN-SO-5 TaxID=3446118 RepID=UPI003EC09232
MNANHGGITITKFVNSATNEPDDGIVVTFRVESDRDDHATVRLEDDCFEDEAYEHAVTFREEHDPENWSVEGDRLVWTRRVAPDSQVITGYDVHPDALPDVDLESPPTIESVEAARRVVHAGDDGSEVVVERTDPDGDATTGGDAGEGTADPEPVDSPPDGEETGTVDDGDRAEAVRRALSAGLDDSDAPSLYHLGVEMAPGATAGDVEMVLDSLENAFYLLGSDPSPAGVRDGSFDGSVDLVVGARLEAETVRRAVESLDPVADVALTQVDDDVVREVDPTALVMAAGDAGCGADDAGERFASVAAGTDPGFGGGFASEQLAAVGDADPVGLTWGEFSLDPDLPEPDRSAEAASARQGDVDDQYPAETGLLDALVEEVRSGGVSERQRTALKRALGLGPKPSVDVRLRYLGGRVDDLAAYTDAIEAFIDEEGTAHGLLTDVQDRLGSLEREHSDLADGLDEQATELSDVRDAVDDLAEAVGGVEADVAQLEATVTDHDDELQEVRATLDDTTTELRETTATTEEHGDAIERHEAAIEATESAIAEFREEDHAALVDRIERLEDAVEENTDWRKRVRSAFD